MSDNILGKINVSQDGVICYPWSIVPCLTSGHGNCPKVVVINDDGTRIVGDERKK